MSYKEKLPEYYKLTKDSPPSELLRESLVYLKNRNNALDLGCGSGSDTKFLLESGFYVTAVDIEEIVKDYLIELPQNNLKIIISKIEDFKLDNYDLVNASRSLPYIENLDFNKTFQYIKQSLNKNGLFVFNLFGKNDQRNHEEVTSHSPKIYFDKDEVLRLINDLEVIKFEEEEKESISPLGLKRNAHIFNIIAKK